MSLLQKAGSMLVSLALAACATSHETEVCERVATCGAPPPAVSQAAPELQPQPRPKPTRYADQNHDGKVTRDEARADPALLRVFDRYDKNKDGVLDRAEFAMLVDDSNRKHPRQEFAQVEAEPAPAQEPAESWRCYKTPGQERHCPGMAPRESR